MCVTELQRHASVTADGQVMTAAHALAVLMDVRAKARVLMAHANVTKTLLVSYMVI